MRPIAPLVAGAAALLLIGYAVGRWVQPARVETRERVVTKTVEVAAKQTEASSESVAQVQTVTRWRYRSVRLPDGTTVIDKARDSGRDSTRSESAGESTVAVRYIDREKLVEKVVVKESARPQWAVAARAGLSVGPRAVYGAEVSRRILGPVSVGVWADTTKAAGVAVRLEW